MLYLHWIHSIGALACIWHLNLPSISTEAFAQSYAFGVENKDNFVQSQSVVWFSQVVN